MVTLISHFWNNYFWVGASIVSAALVVVSSFADRRRHKRSDINDVGFLPWTAITVMSVLGAVIAAALAIKGI
jgi:hypothetical protein